MKHTCRIAILLLSALAPLTPPSLLADSPPNLESDINWRDSGGEYDSEHNIYQARFGGVEDIEFAYNHARREEEKQLGLAAGSLGDLDLPPQTTWDGMSDDAKALYLVNAERTARAGMKPGVIGLPLAGIESHIDAISHAYGDRLHDHDLRGHYHDGTPTFRIERDPVIGSRHFAEITYPNDPSQSDPTQEASPSSKATHSDGSTHYFGDTYGDGSCHEFITRSENLAYFASTAPIRLPLERSIYSFIYDDARSHWGHREAVLLQDLSLPDKKKANSFPGYDNNHGSNANEGFMGFYVRSSNIHDNPDNFYEPFGNGFAYGTVVVMNMIDPVADGTPGCHYDVTLRTEDLPSSRGTPTLKAVDDHVTTAINTAVEITPLKNDAGVGNGDAIDIVSHPAHGSAHILEERQIHYLPAADFSGTDSIDYRVTSNNSRSSTATITITVGGNAPAATPRAPTASSPDNGGGGSNLWWLITLMLTALATTNSRRIPATETVV